MTRRIAIYLDGTWNTPESRTNVYTLFEETLGLDARNLSRLETNDIDIDQIRYYDQGVGTMLGNLMWGGLMGRGLDRNLAEAYAFLCTHYREGDHIFIFGFSRGAYTARSLVGMIDRIGLVEGYHAEISQMIHDAVAWYRQLASPRPDGTNGSNPAQQALEELELPSERKDALRSHIRAAPRIRFLGVWDTVGSLGLPAWWRISPAQRERYAFHDTRMSRIVDYAYHALAIDEHRADFKPVLWSVSHPENLEVEQRWFVGAHGNVGGGYIDNYLHHLPRLWLQQMAHHCGLGFYRILEPRTAIVEEPVCDSFANFMLGIYRLIGKLGWHERPILTDNTVNEVIDESVIRYLRRHTDYRPPNLPEGTVSEALR